MQEKMNLVSSKRSRAIESNAQNTMETATEINMMSSTKLFSNAAPALDACATTTVPTHAHRQYTTTRCMG